MKFEVGEKVVYIDVDHPSLKGIFIVKGFRNGSQGEGVILESEDGTPEGWDYVAALRKLTKLDKALK